MKRGPSKRTMERALAAPTDDLVEFTPQQLANLRKMKEFRASLPKHVTGTTTITELQAAGLLTPDTAPASISFVQTEPSLLLTDWIPCTTPPVREGVYEVDDEDGMGGPWYAYWDGQKFGYRTWRGPQVAFDDRHEPTDCDRLAKWRGVRRWVLTVRDFLNGKPTYVAHVSKRGVLYLTDKLHAQWGSRPYSEALSFATDALAVAYATKHARHLKGWKAVLAC